MSENEKHALRKEKKAEEILKKESEGIALHESHKKVEKDIYRAQDDVERNSFLREEKAK